MLRKSSDRIAATATYSFSLRPLLSGAGVRVKRIGGNSSIFGFFNNFLLGFIGGDAALGIFGSVYGHLLLDLAAFGCRRRHDDGRLQAQGQDSG